MYFHGLLLYFTIELQNRAFKLLRPPSDVKLQCGSHEHSEFARKGHIWISNLDSKFGPQIGIPNVDSKFGFQIRIPKSESKFETIA